LWLVEISGFRWTEVSESHEGTNPFEGEETWPNCVGFRDDADVRLIW